MKYLAGVYWERGSTAKSNQDAVILLQVLTARGRVMMAAVCDGMGGLAQGEVASAYVTRRLQEWFYESLLHAIQKRKPYWVIRRSLDRLVYHMQEQLQQYGSREKLSLGTTMTLLVLWEKVYLIWHLGDSRIYRMSGTGRRGRERAKTAEAVCLTKDHARGKHVLTKSVGSFGYERPDFYQDLELGATPRGDTLLAIGEFYQVSLDWLMGRTDAREVARLTPKGGTP